jgi:AcrR family transcriptional regulator
MSRKDEATMIEKTPDRRTQRTRESLIHALLDLIEEKHYDQISVQDIVEHANVGRSTFYAHYENKDDLLNSGFEHLLDRLVQWIDLNEEDQIHFDTSMLFRHAHGHYEIYRTLIWGTGFKLLIEDGQAALSKKIEARLKVLLPDEQFVDTPLPVLAYAIAGVLLALLKWWLDHKMPYPPEQMDAIFQRLMMPGLRDTIRLQEQKTD